ncbi:predicted protein [Fibroporia radiculosa]|uniref:Uncharacterized protein n=1 Tax=Fibroporia radiculosa TaxID=599839 RepID=J7RVP6_9APHY|nr:predicted protein [Fibroporia radiculosa]
MQSTAVVNLKMICH